MQLVLQVVPVLLDVVVEGDVAQHGRLQVRVDAVADPVVHVRQRAEGEVAGRHLVDRPLAVHLVHFLSLDRFLLVPGPESSPPEAESAERPPRASVDEFLLHLLRD